MKIQVNFLVSIFTLYAQTIFPYFVNTLAIVLNFPLSLFNKDNLIYYTLMLFKLK